MKLDHTVLCVYVYVICAAYVQLHLSDVLQQTFVKLFTLNACVGRSDISFFKLRMPYKNLISTAFSGKHDFIYCCFRISEVLTE